MDLFVLPGNGVINKEWTEEVTEKFSDIFDSSQMLYYRHWETGEPNADIDYELGELVKMIGESQEYVIFAKSIGTLITIKGIREGKLNPVRCVFVGSPVKGREDMIGEAFKTCQVPILFVQEDQDPFTTYKELEAFLENYAPKSYLLVEVHGNQHIYPDVGHLKELTAKFVFSGFDLSRV